MATNAKLEKRLQIAEQMCEAQKLKLKQQADAFRGARSASTKLKAAAAAVTHVQRQKFQKKSLNIKPCKLPGKRDHTPQFMAGVRFLRASCLLSNQKASLALHLAHQIFTGEDPTKELGTSVSPSAITKWNVLLGEVDKQLLREVLTTTTSDIHVFADDSNKRGEDRHMVGVHTWSEEKQQPVTYVLANTLVASGSGKNQAMTDHNVLQNVYGVANISIVVGDNASTQSGSKKGHAVELAALFKCETTFVGCYPHILNIALRNGMVQAFGLRGTMQSFNMFQLHYKVGYVHHGKPTYYKSLYVSEKILSTPPPLPQEFVETQWSYIYDSLRWWRRYSLSRIKLGHKI
eukprot:scpid45126/ scgid25179/ 